MKKRAVYTSICLLSGVLLLANGSYIKLKAYAAQLLLEHSWHVSIKENELAPPWPWADTWPVARLQVPRLGGDDIVLAGAKGNSLAFAPGHVTHTSLPGQVGISIISAHRDTHFAYLKQIQVDDKVIVTDANGVQSVYKVINLQVIDEKQFRMSQDITRSILILTTCYPFEAITPGGPLRYLVTTEKI